ncbi:MAG: hypothetical protein ACRD5M_00695 [Candidatus Acidiferrales bacterium]
MKLNIFSIIGVLLVVLGLAALMHPEVKLPAKHEEIQIGPMEVPVETRRVFTVPPVVGGIIIVCGAGLVFLGARKS